MMQQVMSCITIINNTFIDNAEDLDIVMPMCNLVEFFDNYSMASGSLRNYNKHEVNDDANGNNNPGNHRINNNKMTTGKSFEYKTKLIGSCSVKIFE